MCQKKSDDESRVSKDESRFKKKVQGFQGNEEENVTVPSYVHYWPPTAHGKVPLLMGNHTIDLPLSRKEMAT